jgi:MoaD family protein
MMTIKYYAPIRAIVNKQSEETQASSVKEVLDFIKASYGKEAYALAKSALIVVNGVSIGLSQGIKTPLFDGDEIGFLPVCGGG